MNWLKIFLKALLIAVTALQITACSKTVQWEEEVPLNTGETIWVKRTDSYVKGGEPGNPLQMTWGITNRAYEFSWQGLKYSYKRDIKESIDAMLLYISPIDKSISIVGGASDCSKPGYGEFRWTNGSWQLQQNVSQPLIGQARNLMAHYSSEDGEIPARVTSEIRKKEDATPNRRKVDLILEPTRIATNCSTKK